jgi:hypothetical protein
MPIGISGGEGEISMDPAATIKTIREYIRQWQNDPALSPGDVEDLMQHLEGLDGWVSKGGFLSVDWGRKI